MKPRGFVKSQGNILFVLCFRPVTILHCHDFHLQASSHTYCVDLSSATSTQLNAAATMISTATSQVFLQQLHRFLSTSWLNTLTRHLL